MAFLTKDRLVTAATGAGSALGVRQLGKNLAALLIHVYGKAKEAIQTPDTIPQVA